MIRASEDVSVQFACGSRILKFGAGGDVQLDFPGFQNDVMIP
jgi:hypothetical protein